MAIKNICVDVKNALDKPDVMSLSARNTESKMIVNLIAFIVDPDFKVAPQDDNTTRCFSCSKVLEKKAIKRCSKCKSATYCK